MGYFDDETHVQEYIEMAEGFDGRELIEKLKGYLPPGSTLLELGMGPGKDLDLLGQTYVATGSDVSEVFLSLYRSKHRDADLLQLDALTLDTDRRFQCIYSNKVLHHLSKVELKRSFARQAGVLEPNGIALHTFWHGDKEESHHGLRFVYYTIEGLEEVIPPEFRILESSLYKEMEREDSICIVVKRG